MELRAACWRIWTGLCCFPIESTPPRCAEFLPAQFLDGFVMIATDEKGLMRTLIDEVGIANVRETYCQLTVFAVLSSILESGQG